MEYQLYKNQAIRHFRLGSLPGTSWDLMAKYRSLLYRDLRSELGYFEALCVPEVGDLHGCLHYHILSASTPKQKIDHDFLATRWGIIAGAPEVWINQVAFPHRRVDLRPATNYLSGYLSSAPGCRMSLTRGALPKYSSIDYKRLKVIYGDLIKVNQWGYEVYRSNSAVITAWRDYLASHQPFERWFKSYRDFPGGQLRWA